MILRNVSFWKIAPRLRDTLIFERTGSPKPFQNQPQMEHKWNRILNRFLIDFRSFLAPKVVLAWINKTKKRQSNHRPVCRIKIFQAANMQMHTKPSSVQRHPMFRCTKEFRQQGVEPTACSTFLVTRPSRQGSGVSRGRSL